MSCLPCCQVYSSARTLPLPNAPMELHALTAIDAIEPERWDALNGTDNPFLQHAFLHALEVHGAVSKSNGWAPQHLVLFDDERLVAAAPAYLKANSWGEFVFDFAWANAYAQHGLEYYPKLVVAVPYSPVNGPRLLLDPSYPADTLRTALADGARSLAEQLNLSSVHILFPLQQEQAALGEAGYLHRLGCQFHWRNRGYVDFEAFLADFTAKKRKNIRRERRLVADQGITLHTLHGHDIDSALWANLHRFYVNTFDSHGNIPVISQACFETLAEQLGEQMVVFVAKLDDQPIATAICLRSQDTLYGRYWGALDEYPGLHFETCYYQGIDYCIRHGLERYEPGAQGEHKIARGFLPVLTHSAHYLLDDPFHDAVARFLERERPAVQAYASTLRDEGPFRAEILEQLPHER